jgi:hypothetical protein
MPKKRGRPKKKPSEEPVVTYAPEPDPSPDAAETEKAGADDKPSMTSIQLTPAVRDRLWKLKFRKTYDAFLAELCEMYEVAHKEE